MPLADPLMRMRNPPGDYCDLLAWWALGTYYPGGVTTA